MLLRAYRFTDKLGIVFLKTALAVVDATLDGLSIIWRPVAIVLAFIVGALWSVLSALVGLMVRFFGLILRMVGVRTARTTRVASGTMARRAARAQMQAGVAEDPLRAQNRALSGLTVVLLAVLVGVV